MFKNIFTKVVFWIVVLAVIYAVDLWIINAYYSTITTDVAVNQLKNSDQAYIDLRTSEIAKNWVTSISWFIAVLFTILLFVKDIRNLITKMKSSTAFLILFSFIMLGSITGCRKPYDKPEYQSVETSESAFVIPLEGDTSKQVKLNSEEALKALQVSIKRVQITHRWNQTGRMGFTGEWIANIRLVKVDRKPITREWTAEKNSGTSPKDEGIWVESKDSVGFSTGIIVSGMIKEENAALFLYRYPSGLLETAMDKEVRSRVQTIFSDFSARYDMSDLRGKKEEIAKAIREDVIPFFEKWGITITNIGITGGFKYENPKIQDAIDGVFIAQREKEVAAALLEAQKDKNSKITQEADALAEKERKIAKGVADGKGYILAVAKQAAQDPVFIELRKLDVSEKMIEKWNGQFPQYYLGMGSGSSSAGGLGMLLSVPSAVPSVPEVKK